MASRAELTILSAKIREFGSNLTASEQKFLNDMISKASSDVLDDSELEQVAGGKPKSWVQAGCFG
jgi:hypothetical protein